MEWNYGFTVSCGVTVWPYTQLWSDTMTYTDPWGDNMAYTDPRSDNMAYTDPRSAL